MSLDGSPQLFFEDVFNIGYLGNRYNHHPDVDSTLPARSDIENLIWCHQNLHFKDGAYLVRWQAADALVIERSAKALIGVTDNWNTWQNLTGVQTSWSDGNVLRDYSGANGTATRTVYGGGKVDISIPPCDGTAAQGRKGYCVWAPQGVTQNYSRPSKVTTQEWEMADDLGDRHANSLQQGGKLPTNSLDCRTVGRIYAKNGSTIKLELYPEIATNSVCLVLLNKDCNPIDSMVGVGNLVFNKVATYDGWYTIRIRNATATQAGQKCWVKATYNAPEVIQTNVTKNKCSCSISPVNVGIEEIIDQIGIYPNPANDKIYIESAEMIGDWSIYDLNGKEVEKGNASNTSFSIDISSLKEGSYIFVSEMEGYVVRKKIVKLTK